MRQTPEEIREMEHMHIKVYIHCKNGHGRTTIFLTAYFMRKKGISFDQAIAIVKERRPSGHFNELQRQFLVELEGKFK